MATVITRSAHPDMLWPGVLEIFGLNYEEFPDLWPKYFDRIDGELATERLIEATGFGLARTKTEGAPITYDTDAEGYATLATPAVIGLGYQVTREELEDGLYTEVSLPRAESLAFSEHITIELIHANMFLNGFSSSFKFGDGVSIFNASHPTKSGNQSNLNGQSGVAADFSEASLEDMVKQIFLTKNSRGLQINLRPLEIMVSAADMFNSVRVLESQLRTNTANNDINAVKQMGPHPQRAVRIGFNPYLRHRSHARPGTSRPPCSGARGRFRFGGAIPSLSAITTLTQKMQRRRRRQDLFPQWEIGGDGMRTQ